MAPTNTSNTVTPGGRGTATGGGGGAGGSDSEEERTAAAAHARNLARQTSRQREEADPNTTRPLGFHPSVRTEEIQHEWGYKHGFARALSTDELRLLCKFMDKYVKFRMLPSMAVAKLFAHYYALYSSKKFLKRKKQGSAVAVVMPKELGAYLGDNVTIAAPTMDNVFTMGPSMSPVAFKKGQDMFRHEAGHQAVNTIHHLLEVMESYGTEGDATKEYGHIEATRSLFLKLRDQLNAKFPPHA